MYLVNLGFVLTLILQITSALVYQLLFMAIKRSKAGVSGDLSESLSFRTCFVYYSIFLILKMINPLMCPVHWLIISGSYSCAEECSAYSNVYTIVSWVSTYGHLNITHDFGWQAATFGLLEMCCMGAYLGVGACPEHYCNSIRSIHTCTY